MQRNVYRGVGGIGEICAVIQRKVRIRVTQDKGCNAPAFQFLPQAAGESYGNIFFRKRRTESLAAIVAPMAGVHNREVTARSRTRGSRRRLRSSRSTR